MRTVVVVAWVTVLAACGSQGEAGEQRAPTASATPGATPVVAPAGAVDTAPDLTACPSRASLEEGLRERTEPIRVPPVLRHVMRSNMDNFAFSTLGGATVCVDASWIESVSDPALSTDKRFASFDWGGYESFGHIIVDRSGRGVVADTGMPPVASPSGKLLAAADLSESGFGALNAFAMWQVEPTGLRELAKQQDVPPAADWRIERWAGEDCINLSAVAWDKVSEQAGDAREPYRARRGNRWTLEPGRCPGP